MRFASAGAPKARTIRNGRTSRLTKILKTSAGGIAAASPGGSLCFSGPAVSTPALSLLDRYVIPLGRAGVELARAADLLVGVRDHLVPLRHPADGAGEGEQSGEHGGRKADRRQHDARIEIDVRI